MFGFHSAAGSDSRSVLAALGRSLAIIEFDPRGMILSANENFCDALGYGLAEIKGRHHSLFVEPDYARSHDYQAVLGQARPRRIRHPRIQADRQRRPRGLDPGVLQSGDRRAGRGPQGRQIRDR